MGGGAGRAGVFEIEDLERRSWGGGGGCMCQL